VTRALSGPIIGHSERALAPRPPEKNKRTHCRCPSGPISRVLSPGGPGWRSSIWDGGYPPPQAAYPEVQGDEQPPGAEHLPSCLALLPVGFAQPTPSLEPLVVSYTTVSPSLAETSSLLSVALFRRVTPPGCYPAPCSAELGLSSDGAAPSATAWPAWAPYYNITQMETNVNRKQERSLLNGSPAVESLFPSWQGSHEKRYIKQERSQSVSLSRPQLSCGVEALAGEFRLKAPLQVIPCGLLSLGCQTWSLERDGLARKVSCQTEPTVL